jgi:hypothetical protein
MDSLFRGYGVEIQLTPNYSKLIIDPKDEFKDSFLKVRETLTRIGIASKKDQVLYQSCHILHKRGHYAILHFKELFALDGKLHNFSEEDKQRRNKIVSLLEEWNLLKVVNPSDIKSQISLNQIKILPWNDKESWKLVSKYSIGTRKD